MDIVAAGGAVFNDGDLLVKAAKAGLGVSYIMEDQVMRRWPVAIMNACWRTGAWHAPGY